MATVEFRNITKIFDDGTCALADFDLQIADGELMVLVGPSGCGKTTLLRLLAGLEQPTSGELRIDDRVVNHLPPQQRDVAMVFQNYALYPHMTVRRNLAFPLRMRKLGKEEIRERIARVAALLDLAGLLERKPRELSGGQRQRVAMGRALVREPKVFLMDEPLSNLDARLRQQIRGDIAALQRRLGITTLYVTHDQIEAMTLGHRVAVLARGRLQQVAAPQRLYERPANLFVARFMGNPGMNVFRTVLRPERDHGLAVRWERRWLPLGDEWPPALSAYIDRPLYAGLRPEAIRPPDDPQVCARVEVEVTGVEALGHETLLYFKHEAMVTDTGETPGKHAGNGTHRSMAARLPGAVDARPGARIQLGLLLKQLHFFDSEGRALPVRPKGSESLLRPL